MDAITLGLGVSSIAALPLGAIIKRSYTQESRITTLEANARNAKEKLDSIDEKLDRLIERFL